MTFFSENPLLGPAPGHRGRQGANGGTSCGQRVQSTGGRQFEVHHVAKKLEGRVRQQQEAAARGAEEGVMQQAMGLRVAAECVEGAAQEPIRVGIDSVCGAMRVCTECVNKGRARSFQNIIRLRRKRLEPETGKFN
jgi:hypothetical protein